MMLQDSVFLILEKLRNIRITHNFVLKKKNHDSCNILIPGKLEQSSSGTTKIFVDRKGSVFLPIVL